MTPGWTNVRNGLASSRYPKPRGMPSLRAWTFLACGLGALLLWLLIVEAVIYAPISLLTSFP